ncbi:hypothetical protein ACFQJD_08960 [Haloplanus sp. GCM10025708]
MAGSASTGRSLYVPALVATLMMGAGVAAVRAFSYGPLYSFP